MFSRRTILPALALFSSIASAQSESGTAQLFSRTRVSFVHAVLIPSPSRPFFSTTNCKGASHIRRGNRVVGKGPFYGRDGSSIRIKMQSASSESKDDIPVAPLSFDEIDQIISEWSQVSAVDSQYEETESTVRLSLIEMIFEVGD
jgi:hypothetical protein